MKCQYFKNAVPVWIKNKRSVVNFQAGFRCNFNANQGRKYYLKLTGATLYRIYLNGEFIHYGPARGAHGYVRVDEIELPVKEGINRIAVEVAGYNCNTYYTIKNLSFLCAEIFEGNISIAYTGKDFFGISLEELRVRKAMRYGFQRNFTEVWHLDNNEKLTNWKTCDELAWDKLSSFEITDMFISREVPLPKYEKTLVASIIEKGKIKKKEGYEGLKRRFVSELSCDITGYNLNCIEERPAEEIYCDFIASDSSEGKPEGADIDENNYVIYKMKNNVNGFIATKITVFENSEVYVFFGETMVDGKLTYDSIRGDGINIIKYSLEKSNKSYKLESFESYGFQYIGLALLKGRAKAEPPFIIEYSYPKYKNTDFACSDGEINEIFKASLETFRQNTLDLYMDCPTRERAGWLCDSYFTSQSELFFAGESLVEKVFLNNFVMAKEFPSIPEGMLPMCYPADHFNEMYIPQWALWYIIELEGYFKRTGDPDTERFKPLCYNLLEFFKKYKNEDGLLEGLEGWNFIEWSKANDWAHDVNYPTNMLYGKALEIISVLYNDDDLLAEAEKVRCAIISQSFDGTYFIDNAVRKNGMLEFTQNRSEVCQYYAFFFGTAKEDDKRFAPLINVIINVFGPERKVKEILPEIAYANAFIGNYLRIELLMRWRKYSQVICESKDYFYKMAKLTGTLWEHDSVKGSLNHGFASYAGVAVLKCLTGLADIDNKNKTIIFCFEACPEIDVVAKIGVFGGKIEIERKNGKLKYSVPENYKIIRLDS